MTADDIEITWDQLKNPVTIFDIRTEEETIAEPVPSSIPVQWIPMPQWSVSPPPLPAHTVAIMCRVGRRSAAVTEMLRAQGHDNVFSIAGGILALPDS